MGCCGGKTGIQNVPSTNHKVQDIARQFDNSRMCKPVLRPSCVKCALKHIAQARALLLEKCKGYPHHYWYAMGHLAEAEDELVKEYPLLANIVRDERLLLETNKEYDIDFKNLISLLTKDIENVLEQNILT